jgi:TPR repeat protein
MSRDAVEGSPGAKFLLAVQQAVVGDYEVLGELGRRGRTIVYLAREAKSSNLVALRLQPAPGANDASGDFTLDVVRQLDGSVPAAKVACPRCSRELESWGRYCSHCGNDLAGAVPQSADEILFAVKEAARGRYDVLGKIPRVEGGGVIYFAREIQGGRLVALRLQKENAAAGTPARYVLDRTQVIKSVAEELGVIYGETSFPQKTEQPAQPAIPKESKRAVISPVPLAADGAPPTSPPSPDDKQPTPIWNERTVTLAVAGALVLIVGAFVIGRKSSGGSATSPASAASDTTSTIGLSGGTLARVDSAEVRVDGALPANATLSVDGHATSGQHVRVTPGAHRLRLTASGYLPAEQQVTLEPGERLAWAPQFTRAPSAQHAKAKATPHTNSQNTGRAAQPSTQVQTCVSLFDQRDWGRALTTCQSEAATGNTSSQLLLGLMYDRGFGVSPDAPTAVKWYTQAADAGHRVAAYRVGVLRRDGAPGVPRDEAAAFRWFERSAQLGEPDAELALADAYFRGKGVGQNKTEGIVWYRTAADHGLAEAQFQLGQLYARGDAVVKSEPTAITWFQRAAAQGHTSARDELARRGIKP